MLKIHAGMLLASCSIARLGYRSASHQHSKTGYSLATAKLPRDNTHPQGNLQFRLDLVIVALQYDYKLIITHVGLIVRLRQAEGRSLFIQDRQGRTYLGKRQHINNVQRVDPLSN